MSVKNHPGEILLEKYLKPNGLSANALALALGVPSTRMSDIIHGKRGITADTAVRLGKFFGNDPEYWMNLQNARDISLVLFEKRDDIVRVQTMGEVLNRKNRIETAKLKAKENKAFND